MDINNLKLSTLMDMLASHTNKLMKMLKDGYTYKEYEDCKNMVNKIAAEIEVRKKMEEDAGMVSRIKDAGTNTGN